MDVEVGDIFFASHYRLDALWHITGEFTSLSSVKIHRIWRDDKLAAWPLDYKVEETKPGRVVTAVQIGERQAERWAGPFNSAPWFRVDNRKHIFSYDQEEEVKTRAPIEAIGKLQMQTGDIRLFALLEEWNDLRKKIDESNDDDPSLDNMCRHLESLEIEVTATPASTNAGALHKLTIADYYLRQAVDNDWVPSETILGIVRSVQNDIK